MSSSTTLRSNLVITSILALVSCSAMGQDSGVFSVKGKVNIEKLDLEFCELILVHSENLDSNRVELNSGKFNFLLGLNSTYLLLLRQKNVPVKKILISTAAPASESGYKMKLTIDVAGGKYKHGIIEHNGFEHRFIIKVIRENTLKLRKHEFLTFYEYMMQDIE
jgi:hypothetical protein